MLEDRDMIGRSGRDPDLEAQPNFDEQIADKGRRLE
jgi:hypothetical protein